MFNVNGNLINFDAQEPESIKRKALMNAYRGASNSGFEIDEVEFFKDGAIAGEFPELKEEINLMISTESLVVDLLSLQSRIRINKGMTRNMGMELLEMIPTLESHTSVRHFTEQLSGIGVETSLEAIDFKLWGIIAAAVAFIGGLIYKFRKWMTGNSDGKDTPSASETKEVGEKFDENLKANEDMGKIVDKSKNEEVVAEIPAVQDHPKIENSHLPDTIKDAILGATSPLGSSSAAAIQPGETVEVKFSITDVLLAIDDGRAVHEYIKNPNRYARLLFGNRTRTLRKIIAAFTRFDNIVAAVKANFDFMEEVTETFIHYMGGAVNEQGSVVSSAIGDLKILKFSSAGIEIDGPLENLLDFSNQLMDEIGTEENVEEFKDIGHILESIRNGMTEMASVKWQEIHPIYALMEQGEKALHEATEMVENIKRRNAGYDLDPDVERRSRDMLALIRELQSNIVGLMKLFSILTNTYREVTLLNTKVLTVITSNAHGIASFYRRYDLQMPEVLAGIIEEIEEEARLASISVVPAQFMPVSSLGQRVSIAEAGSNPHSGVSEHDTGVRLEDLTPRMR